MPDICHTKGDDYVQPIEISSYDDGVETPVDLTGSTVIMAIKKGRNDTEIFLETTAVLTDAVNGIASIRFTAEQMNINEAQYWYGIQWTDSLGIVRTIQKGKLTITYDPT